MATLTGKKVKDTYKDLLQVSNSNSGIDSTLRTLADGEGTDSVLQLSSAAVNISSAGALQYAGTAITSTAAELNILDGVTATTAELNYVDGVTSNIQTQLDSKVSAILTQEQVEDFVGGMLDGTETGISVSYDDTDGNIDFVVASQTDENFTTADHSKLDGIEASADVTDATNVTAAGALMDSEISNLSFVKGLTSGISNTNVLVANAAVSDNDFLKIDGTSVEGRTAAEVRSDLNVEDGATADQSNAEIVAAVEAGSDSNTFTDADHSKLNAIEASADVTDTANVTSSGALMDSELASIADVKALDQSVVSGATPTFTTTNFTDASNKRLMTDAQETKLDSVESSADVTDTANVTSAGALMDSELTDLAGVKGVTISTLQAKPSEGAFANGDKTKLDAIEASATADQTDEEIQDVVGAMFSSNTETGITATYQDGDGTIDLVVGTLNQDTTGTASKTTVTNSTANTNFPVVFHDESNALLDDTGALRYNPSTGELLVPKLTVAGTTTQVDTVTMEAANAIKFEGATADANETILSIVDPTNDDNTQYLLNASGYIPLLNAVSTTVITATPTELNYVDGVTSSIQTQLDATLDTAGALIDLSSTTINVDLTEAGEAAIANGDYILFLDGGATGTHAKEAIADVATLFAGAGMTATSSVINVIAGTGIDVAADAISVDVSDFMANGADNRILTATGTDAMNAEANLTFDGTDLKLPGDNLEMRWGASDDFKIYVDTVTAYLKNVTQDGDIRLQINDGGSNLTAIKIDGSEIGQVALPNDNQELKIGGGGDLRLYHNATDSYITNQTGNLNITVNDNDKDLILLSDDGSGGTTAYLTLDGSAKYVRIPDDGIRLTLGADNDLAIFHNGTNGFIGCDTGDLIIQTTTADKDIILKSDDGSGGETAYLTLDGSTGHLNLTPPNNVGIGTSSPGNKFTVNSTGANQASIQYDASTRLQISVADSGITTFLTDNNAACSFTNKVGIGTTAPAVDLHILDTGGHSQLRIETDNAGSGAYLELEDTTNKYVIGNVGGDLVIDESGVAERFRIKDSTGSIGIGTSTPDSYNAAGRNLVVADSGDSGISIVAGTTSDSSIMFADGTGGTAGYRGRVAYDHNGDYLRFDTAATERVRIDSAGLVGIGTTSPGAKLDIENSTAPTLDNDTHAGEAIFLRSGGSGGDGNVQAVLAFGKADSSSRRSGSAIASVQTDSDVDKVGIGFYTSDSSASSQTMDLRMLVNHTGNLHVDADVVAYSTSVSDERLKDNIETIPNALDKVMQLRGVEFDWNKGNRKGQKDLGLIAQEVEKVLPEIVREKKMAFIDNEIYKTIDYDKIVGVLVEAIKEQQKQINKLEEKLNG